MDKTTVDTYSASAGQYADEWLGQPAPDDLYERLRRFFKPGGMTADIGCGAGRDTAWLQANGYPAVGYDASEGLLERARAAHAQCVFKAAALPELRGIEDGAFDNVLCETVIMHLPPEQIAAACRRLAAILKPGGMLYLSWRVTEGADLRDKAGRLYTAFDSALVLGNLPGTRIVFTEDTVNQSSGKRVCRVVAERL
ncbi:bifunctional 2-polyprenyl-6-hydroxyphenol methylase/3-demethylubiquinol 3-O-methyltransferase UbiG [Bordetella sp. FB-8]|uniref:class I SAM-dependent methyltransferase n=1 Tax=Bordetella sp. FB-8 TaxID=1159870 RepID=UPI0003819B74|nr:methyltransferase domain-containing protein [Bordetella sp. FB-8]